MSALCWISDNMVASGSWDHSIHIWDVGSGVSTQRLVHFTTIYLNIVMVISKNYFTTRTETNHSYR